jgi:hypothetical protein
MHIVKRSHDVSNMEDARRPASLRDDRTTRSSTGNGISPLDPVDGVELLRSGVATIAAQRQDPRTANTSQESPTSIELLRQLEACVRELLDISTKSHES